jgi:hypothetical protein
MPTNELGSLKLPATKPYRVVIVGASYQDAVETIGPDGKPTVVYQTKLAYHGEEIELNEYEARRLEGLGAVKPADAPKGYAELSVDELQAEADSRGLSVEGSGADGNVLKDDLINALNTYDAGASSTDSGAAVAASAPGGVSVSDARNQSGRRVSA